MGGSGEELPNDRAGDVGEAVVAAGVAAGPPGMVEAGPAEDGGVEVVPVAAALGDRDPGPVGRPGRGERIPATSPSRLPVPPPAGRAGRAPSQEPGQDRSDGPGPR